MWEVKERAISREEFCERKFLGAIAFRINGGEF